MTNDPPVAQSNSDEQPDEGPPSGPDDNATAQDTAAASDSSDRPTEAWAAARELSDYAPRSFGSISVDGDQRGVVGNNVAGDLVFRNQYFVAGADTAERLQGSGEVPGADLDQLAEVFHDSPTFHEALAELRTSRVVVLRGEHDSGRRAAALMLLRHAGAARVRALAPDAGPTVLVKEAQEADGYVAYDLPTSRSKSLAPHHFLACQERMRKQDAYFVITVESSAVLRDVPWLAWPRPEAEAVLTSHLRSQLRHSGDEDDEGDAALQLLRLPQVRDFLAVSRRPVAQIAAFARAVARHHRGEIGAEQLERFGEETLREQVRDWLSAPDERIPLRDKAFLMAMAVCDEGPYATAAELGDQLCREMQRVESPEEDPGLPIFSTSRDSRMELARAEPYEENELTPWGPVPQTMARFQDQRTTQLLLREAWTGHPAVRAPLAAWLTDLARHSDPFVRTRAAATAATLAGHDFSSVMHGLLLGWASSHDYRLCLQAANALTLAATARGAAVQRVLREWSTDTHPRRRWTAVRAHALLGRRAPEDTLDSLEDLVRRASTRAAAPTDLWDQSWDELWENGPRNNEFGSLVEAVELLLLDTPGTAVPRRLAAWCADGAASLRLLAQVALLTSAHRREDPFDDPASWPLLLRRYAEAPGHAEASARSLAGSPVRRALAELWRHVLRDRAATGVAQEQLRQWVLVAAREPGAEAALAELLPHLVASDADRDRLGHLLRTMPGEDGGPPPPVAARLLAATAAP